MFDAKLLPLQRRLIRPLAGRLHARGVGADSITLAGFALGLLGVLAAAYGLFWLALAGVFMLWRFWGWSVRALPV